MAIAPDDTDELVDEFLSQNGHEVATWDEDYNKKQCPECGALHDTDATHCSVCGWRPGE